MVWLSYKLWQSTGNGVWPSWVFVDNLLEIVWPFWDCSGLSYFLWYDYPINFDNLLELGCDYTRIVGDHTGIAVVLFSTEFFILTGVWHWGWSLVWLCLFTGCDFKHIVFFCSFFNICFYLCVCVRVDVCVCVCVCVFVCVCVYNDNASRVISSW